MLVKSHYLQDFDQFCPSTVVFLRLNVCFTRHLMTLQDEVAAIAAVSAQEEVDVGKLMQGLPCTFQ